MKNLKIISLGMGVQSTALYYMSSMGIIPRCDYAIFADPGRESTETYAYLKFLRQWAKENNGIPIIHAQNKNLYKDLLNEQNSTGQRFSSIPAFTMGEDGKAGMLRRQCTAEYKIQVVNDSIRELYNLKPRQRRPMTEVYIGISLDEIERLAMPRESWKINIYPFCGYAVSRIDNSNKIETEKYNRSDLYNWYRKNNLPIPPKSSCVFCSFQSDRQWAIMKKERPKDFQAACRVDNKIRNSTAKGINSPCYLHNSLKPLGEVKFDETMDIPFGECSGNCHI